MTNNHFDFLDKFLIYHFHTICRCGKAAVRVVELMFVFGDAARLVWQVRRTHKFLIISSSGDILVADQRRVIGRSRPTGWVGSVAGGGEFSVI